MTFFNDLNDIFLSFKDFLSRFRAQALLRQSCHVARGPANASAAARRCR